MKFFLVVPVDLKIPLSPFFFWFNSLAMLERAKPMTMMSKLMFVEGLLPYLVPGTVETSPFQFQLYNRTFIIGHHASRVTLSDCLGVVEVFEAHSQFQVACTSTSCRIVGCRTLSMDLSC
jgi:hypothetical protein